MGKFFRTQPNKDVSLHTMAILNQQVYTRKIFSSENKFGIIIFGDLRKQMISGNREKKFLQNIYGVYGFVSLEIQVLQALLLNPTTRKVFHHIVVARADHRELPAMSLKM